jgi:heat shock protein HtpX
MFIVNPLHARAVDSMFSTHPSVENRVRKLREMAVESGQIGPWG